MILKCSSAYGASIQNGDAMKFVSILGSGDLLDSAGFTGASPS